MSDSKTDPDETDDDALTYMALVGYANWIETGDFLLSARDAHAQEKTHNALNVDQMRRVVRVRDLADAALRRRGA